MITSNINNTIHRSSNKCTVWTCLQTIIWVKETIKYLLDVTIVEVEYAGVIAVVVVLVGLEGCWWGCLLDWGQLEGNWCDAVAVGGKGVDSLLVVIGISATIFIIESSNPLRDYGPKIRSSQHNTSIGPNGLIGKIQITINNIISNIIFSQPTRLRRSRNCIIRKQIHLI